MADVIYPTDATSRTAATLESDDMSFMGFDSSEDPLMTDYSDIKSAIETEIASDFLSKTNTTTYTPTADYHPSTKKYVDDNSSSLDYILVRDVKTSGTNGGTFTSGSPQTRDLTEITYDTGSHASLSSNQITLAPGEYLVTGSAPAYAVDKHQTTLYNITDSSTDIVGSTEYARAVNYIYNRSFLYGRLLISSSKIFELRHECQTTKTSTGLGTPASFNDEVYAILEFIKIG